MNAPQLICCLGPGGVGKTTIAAAYGAFLASQNKRVCCLTIDPSKRLATALGMRAPFSVQPVSAQVQVKSQTVQLDVMAMNVKASISRLVKELVGPELRHVEANRIFQLMQEELLGLEHYMAVDILDRLSRPGRYDAVILDTPPTRHAIEFLRAPERLLLLFNHTFFAFFVKQYGGLSKSRLSFLWDIYKLGTQLLERVFGISFLKELAQFFAYFESSLPVIRQKVQNVVDWIQTPSTRSLLVTYDYSHISELSFYVNFLKTLGLKQSSCLFNQSLVGIPLQLKGREQDLPAWALSLKRRAAVQKEALEKYAAWAKLQRLDFRTLPYCLEPLKPQELIGFLATHFESRSGTGS
jgi:anion-transporting  ArsA/GET3 family ATPase